MPDPDPAAVTGNSMVVSAPVPSVIVASPMERVAGPGTVASSRASPRLVRAESSAAWLKVEEYVAASRLPPSSPSAVDVARADVAGSWPASTRYS